MTSILFVIVRTYHKKFKWYYLKNKNIFIDSLLNAWYLHQILNISKKKITLITYILSKLQTVKDKVCVSKKLHFRTPFDSEQAKRSQTLHKFAWPQLYQIFQSLYQKVSWKMSLLVISEILALLVNTLTPDEKYSLRNSENLLQTIQMQ